MKVVTSTDSKYVGTEVPDTVKVGDVVSLEGFDLELSYVRVLENGRVCIGNPNYQLILEV